MGAETLARRVAREQAELRADLDSVRAFLASLSAPPDPVAWAERVSGGPLDPWQADFMCLTAPRALLACGRRVGKTQVVSLRSAFRARHARRRVGVLSPTLRQSQIMHRRVREWFETDNAPIVRATSTEIELANGSAFVAFPGDRPDLSVRGDTLDDLIVDEAGFIRDSVIAAASPTIATRPGATETMLGTPAGRRGAFHKEWTEGDGWERIRVPTRLCPRVTPEFLARERRRLGPLFAQEYEAEFLSGPGALFDSGDLDAMFAAVPAPDDTPEPPATGGWEL